MVETRSHDYDDYEEDTMSKYEDDLDNDDLKDPFNDEPMNSGESLKSQNAIDKLFSPEDFLMSLRRAMLGDKIVNGRYISTGNGIARTPTIDKIINSLRSVINIENMLSGKTDEEIKFILLEKNKEVIYMMYDDPSVDEDEVEHLSNILDHSVEMFMGIVQSGDGSEAARQILTGNYMRLNDKGQEYNPAFRLGTSNFDLMTIGGRRKNE